MDTLFLILSKTVWFLIRPESILIGLFCLSWLCLYRGWKNGARRILSGSVMAALAIAIFPIDHIVFAPLERAYPIPEVTEPAGLIILGGAEHEAPNYANYVAQVNDAGERLITAMSLARTHPQAKVLYAGGKLALRPAAPGSFELGPDLLRSMGLEEARLIIEGQSRSTAENAALSRALVPDQGSGDWVLITSAFHMPRAIASFCAAGWRNLVPYPVDFRGGRFWSDVGWDFSRNLYELNIGVKEWVGLIGYRITGRTRAMFVERC